MQAGTTMLEGHGGDQIEAYVAVPVRLPQEPRLPGVVVIHHMPGFDAATKEITRRFAANGYAAIMPNLHYREAPGADPDDAAAANRAAGGVPDERLTGDVKARSRVPARAAGSERQGRRDRLLLGRTAVLPRRAAPPGSTRPWTATALSSSGTPPKEFPVPITPLLHLTPQLGCPLLGLFGNEDKFPSPEQVDELEAALKEAGKTYEFHRYDEAGHGFFAVDRPNYRQAAATDGWVKIFDFYGRTLAG